MTPGKYGIQIKSVFWATGRLLCWMWWMAIAGFGAENWCACADIILMHHFGCCLRGKGRSRKLLKRFLKQCRHTTVVQTMCQQWCGWVGSDQTEHNEMAEPMQWKGGIMTPRDFPCGAVVKNPPANAGDTGSSPGPGRSHMPRSN